MGATRPAPRLGTDASRSPSRDGSPGEHDPAAGSQHPVKLGERAPQVGQVVQHRVAEHEVEAAGRRTAATRRRRAAALTSSPSRSALARRVETMPGEMSVQVACATTPGLQQVEAEVAGAGADLERAVIALVELGPEQLAQLAEHLALADLAEVDPPLGVVAVGGDVVVARVDVADLVGVRTASIRRRRLPCRARWPTPTVQRDQPAGVPPLDADRRAHAARRPGRELLVPAPPGRLRVDRRARDRRSAWSTWPAARDTAPRCSSRGAASVLGVEANPEAFEHARLRYPRQNLRFERGLVETHGDAGQLRRGRVPADDRARPRPGGGAAPLRAAAGARRRRLRLDPEPADDRAARRREVLEPVAHQGVPRARVRRAVPDRVRRGRAAGPVPRSPAARARAGAARSAGTRSTGGCG